MSTSIANATAANLTDTNAVQVQQALSQPAGISLRGTKATPEQIAKTAEDFEAQFVTQMLASMDTSSSKDSLGGSDDQDMYKSMLNNEYGKIIAKTGGIGVADQVKRAMISQQEVER